MYKRVTLTALHASSLSQENIPGILNDGTTSSDIRTATLLLGGFPHRSDGVICSKGFLCKPVCCLLTPRATIAFWQEYCQLCFSI